MSYIINTEKAINFLIDKMLSKDGLNATYKDGKSHINAYLDDYAFLINSILNFLSIKWNNELFGKTLLLTDLLIDKFLDH